MRIIVENSAMLNGGDAAIHAATVKVCKLAFGEETEVLFLDQKFNIAKRLYPELAIHPQFTSLVSRRFTFRALVRLKKGKDLFKLFQAYCAFYESLFRFAPAILPRDIRNSLDKGATADLRLASGGTYISSHYGADRIAVEFSRKTTQNIPLMFMTQTIESFEKNTAFQHLGKIFSGSPLVLLRDPKSAEIAGQIAGQTINAQVVPDAAFCLADTARLKKLKENAARRKQLRVLVSVRSWRFFKNRSNLEGMQNYKASIQRITTELIRRFNADVVFLSTCQGVPEYEYDDSSVAKEFVSELPKDVRSSVSVDYKFRKPSELLEEIENFDAVISTRMHMAILALCKGVPVLPISYERKTTDLFTNIGMNDLILDIETINEEDAAEKAILLIEQLDHWQHLACVETLRLHTETLKTVDFLQNAWKELNPPNKPSKNGI